jgi:hypothetical protein
MTAMAPVRNRSRARDRHKGKRVKMLLWAVGWAYVWPLIAAILDAALTRYVG